MRDLAGKTAFVTGGASGIGFALGRAFVDAGMKVMLADIEKDALAIAVENLHEFGADVRGVACDVAASDSVERAAKAANEAFGKSPCGLQQCGCRRPRRRRQHFARKLAMGARREPYGSASRHPYVPSPHSRSR